MEYGHFSENGKVYTITTPKTPTPWKNILFNDTYFLEASQRLCGPSWGVVQYKRFPILESEKHFYIRIEDKVYPLGKGAGRTYACEHHIHKSVLTEEFDAFASRITVFVPAEGRRELWKVEITNKTNAALCVQVFSCFEIANIAAYQSLEGDFMNGYFCKSSFPYHFKYDEYEALKPTERKVYVMSDRPVKSYECSKERYFGFDLPGSLPAMVENGAGSNKKCEYRNCVAGFHQELSLETGQTDGIVYMAGEAKTFEEVDSIRAAMPDFDEELALCQARWEEYTKPLQIRTPYEDLNRMVSHWVKKQMRFLCRHNRSNIGCPIRNQLQDAMGYAVLEPEEAMKYALHVLHRQHFNGYIKQWYMTDGSPDAGLCLIRHSDACAWLIICMIETIRLTGNNAYFYQEEGYMDTDVKESILTHLKKAALFMAQQVGEHGLCLLLDGDWTDPLNGPGRLGKGESTWNTLALIYAIRLLCEVEYDAQLDAIRQKLTDVVNAHCWDTDRYVPGIDDFGVPFGQRTDKEASLFLNAQTWALFAGVCDKEREQIVRKTIEDNLKTDFGYLLLDPPFEGWNPTWGKVSIKQKGNTENGSVYSHGNMFKAYADFVCGDYEPGIQTMRMILPSNPLNGPEKNLQVPIWLPNYYFGCQGDNFGLSSNVYGTGAAAWILWLANRYLKS